MNVKKQKQIRQSIDKMLYQNGTLNFETIQEAIDFTSTHKAHNVKITVGSRKKGAVINNWKRG